MKYVLICSDSITNIEFIYNWIENIIQTVGKDNIFICMEGSIEENVLNKIKEKIDIRFYTYKIDYEKYKKKAISVRDFVLSSNNDFLYALWDGKDKSVASLIIGFLERNKKVDFKIVPVVFSMWNFLFIDIIDAICITTNGYISSKGKAVLGRGNAFTSRVFIPDIEIKLGNYLKEYGNKVQVLGKYNNKNIINFPVKPGSVIVNEDKSNIVYYLKDKVDVGDEVGGFLARADLNIIKDSCNQLAKLIDELHLNYVVLPKPGVGAGELSWSTVKRTILDTDLYNFKDRVIIVSATSYKLLSKFSKKDDFKSYSYKGDKGWI